tara:strand:+ start:1057 stop:1641 length:585 start_codon:yes stop_codon:yes gene_type:complete
MTLTHILETLTLVLATYLSGCIVGYATRRVLHAGRGTRKVTPAAAVLAPAQPEAALRPRRQMTSAARLAAAATDDPTSVPAAPARQTQPETAPLRQARPAATPVGDGTQSVPKPSSMARPRPGGADNLKQIKGVGPKIERALNGLGIYHFDQIAAWSSANIEWVDKQLTLRGRITRERWVAQAAGFADLTRASA